MNTDNIEIEINPDYTMHKVRDNGINLSNEEIDILKEYNIDYMNFHSLNELIMELDELYDETGDDIINNLLDRLSERDYYENYNK